MKIAEIKAAVDFGQIVHWANEGYLVHKDGLGQYLITYQPNGSTIGLTDRSGDRLNGAEAEFFISEAAKVKPSRRGFGRKRGVITSTPTMGRTDGQGKSGKQAF